MKRAKSRLAIFVLTSFLLGIISVPTANSISKYVTQKQRVKDLTDIAEQIVKLQGRINYLEKCVQNLSVDRYSSGAIQRVNC